MLTYVALFYGNIIKTDSLIVATVVFICSLCTNFVQLCTNFLKFIESLRELFSEVFKPVCFIIFRTADYTLGIFQSIGFKEFHDYLLMDEQGRQTRLGKAHYVVGNS